MEKDKAPDPEFESLSGEAAEKAAQQVDVVEIMAKYDKESAFRVMPGFWGTSIALISIAFSLFHLYTAAFGQLAPQLQRSIHLGFTFCLVFLLYPAYAKADRSHMHWYDIALAALGMWVLRLHHHQLPLHRRIDRTARDRRHRPRRTGNPPRPRGGAAHRRPAHHAGRRRLPPLRHAGEPRPGACSATAAST